MERRERISTTGYSLYGVCHFNNIPAFLDGYQFPEEKYLGEAKFTTWYACLYKSADGTHIYPSLSCDSISQKDLVEISLTIRDTSNQAVYQKTIKQELIEGDGCNGPEIPIFLLNGWLNQGQLSIGYKIRHLAFLNKFNFYEFNFYDKLCTEGLCFMFRDHDLSSGYQMINFHSNYFDKKINKDPRIRRKNAQYCLQVIHGARIKMSMIEALDTLSVAAIFKMHTVIEYCQREIIEQHLDSDQPSILSNPNFHFTMRVHNYQRDKWTVFFLEFAMKLGLRHYLCHLLKGLETFDEFMDSLRKIDLEKCKGESMKMMMKHFYEKF